MTQATIGKILKINFFVLLWREDITVKTWISSYLATQRVQKSLFYCSRPKDTRYMVIFLCHVKTIVRNWFFFTDFCHEEKWCKKKLIHQWIPLFIAKTIVQIVTLDSIVNYFPYICCAHWLFCCCYFARILIFNNQKFQKCTIMSGFHRSGTVS